jgi:3-hydroxyisobutyrate dehydrogenase
VEPVGFLGLGRMGEPMASNLQRGGRQLVVWNRSHQAADRLAALGAVVRATPREVLAEAPVTLLMLAHENAIDAALDRGGSEFTAAVRGRMLVHMGTTAPEYSARLADDVRAAGGRYVEAPVSGSRVPAQRAELVAMLAGDPSDVAVVETLISPTCRSVLRCGDVPSGMTTKLAVNIFLITMVTGLVESFHFARRHGLDLEVYRTAINSGQMASDVGRVKLDKLISGDLSAQAAIRDVHQNSRLIRAAAMATATATPLMEVCDALYRQTEEAGRGQDDMAAVLHALQLRTRRSTRT